MDNINFQTWRDENPYLEEHFRFPDGEECGWGRIQAKWHEQHEGIDITHICAFTLNLQSGDIYLDCSKLKIWTKCLVLTIGRPLLGVYKTIYHVFLPLSIPVEICIAIHRGIQNQESAGTIAKNAGIRVLNNFADIIRTPLYTVILTIVTLSAVIIGPFAPHKLYDLRALAGRIENALNRGEESFWTMAPCFQPISNIFTVGKKNYIKEDTEYDSEDVLHGLNNLARSYVNYRRENRNPFDDFCRLPAEGVPYISPSYQQA